MISCDICIFQFAMAAFFENAPTTLTILFKFASSSQRLFISAHFVWSVCWQWYRVTFVYFEFVMKDDARIGIYTILLTPHQQFSCSVISSASAPTCPDTHYENILPMIFCIFQIWYHRSCQKYMVLTPQQCFTQIFLYLAGVPSFRTLSMAHLLAIVSCDTCIFHIWLQIQAEMCSTHTTSRFLFELVFLFFSQPASHHLQTPYLGHIVTMVFCNIYIFQFFCITGPARNEFCIQLFEFSLCSQRPIMSRLYMEHILAMVACDICICRMWYDRTCQKCTVLTPQQQFPWSFVFLKQRPIISRQLL